MNNFKFLIVSLAVMLVLSCAKDKNDYFDQKNTSSIVPTPAAGFINLLKLSTEDVNIKVKQDVGTEISAIAVSASYGKAGALTPITTLNGKEGTFSSKVTDLLSKLNKSPNDVKVGENIIFYFDVTDGTGFVSRDRNTVVLPFSCPSELAGTYTSVTSGTSTDACCPTPEADFASEVTLVKLSDGKYQINDFSAGLYLKWYNVYGIASVNDSPGKIQDICGNLSFFDTTEPFATPITGTGTVNIDTKVITYTWKNGYDDTGTVVLTKK